jgi:hypothetical protein
MRLTDDNIADYAETLVRQVRAGGTLLDYSEESVAALEQLLRASDGPLRAPDLPEESRKLVVFYNGCYLGEVMARNLGGVWRFDESNWADSALVFAYRDETALRVLPFLKLWQRITEHPDEHDLVTYYAGLKERLEGRRS